MGCFPSKRRNHFRGYEDPIIFSSQSAFSVIEVQALFELYKSISNSLIDDGLINKEEFQLALFKNRKKENLFANRIRLSLSNPPIFDLFDVKHKGYRDFGDFVRSLTVFHPNVSQQGKMDFSFKLYDLHGMGFIGREDVKQMLIALLCESEMKLADETIEMIIDKILRVWCCENLRTSLSFVADFCGGRRKRDGKINRDEWVDFVTSNPSLLKIMTLPYLRDIMMTFPSFVFHSEVEEVIS